MLVVAIFPVNVDVLRATVNPAPVEPPVNVPTDVKDDVTTVEPIAVPVREDAGAEINVVPAAVRIPLAFTVNVGIKFEEPNDPILELTVAKVAVAPEVVMSPTRLVLVIEVEPENIAMPFRAGVPVVVTVPDPAPVAVITVSPPEVLTLIPVPPVINWAAVVSPLIEDTPPPPPA
jgi:hypothetical protein